MVRPLAACPSEDVFMRWLESRLTPSEAEALTAHIDRCDECRVMYAELARMAEAQSMATIDAARSSQPSNVLTMPTVRGHQLRQRASTSLGVGGQPPAIGRFVVEAVLGEGGMGTVFLARDPDLERRVAVKVLKSGGSDERLLAEARSQAKLSDANVVRVYEVGYGGGGPYIAMEFIEGETLREWLARGQPWREVVTAFRAAGRGLAAAHRAGLVHRDFKPANVLVGVDGRIAVTDFGLARAEPTGASRFGRALTQTGSVMGTPAYMAPEQYRGETATDRTDVFSFGVSLYEGLYGQRPFAGHDLQTLQQAIATGSVNPPPLDSDVPARLRDVILAMLAADPAQRLASMEVALELLGRELGGESARSGCPFPGLAAFDVGDADIYFGRDPEIAEAARKLEASGFVAVIGPSGAGKSSFVRAGLVPALRREARVLEFFVRPGPDPLSRLAAVLAEVSPTESVTADSLAIDPHRLGEALGAFAARQHARVVLVIDQLEELFTLADADAARVVVAALESAAQNHRRGVRVVVTMRSDLLERAQHHRVFMQRVTSSLLFLPNPDRTTLRAALAQPLERVGYRLESDAIADNIARELDGKHGALPLLQFAARRLWASADHAARLVTVEAYEALGELGGLLADHASTTLAALAPDDRALAREVFVRLVTPERTRAIVVTAELERLGHGTDVMRVIESLVQARLIAVSDAEVGQTVELVHESLIDRWPTLSRWLDEVEQGDALFSEIADSARRWNARGRPTGLLWRGDSARRVERFAKVHRGTLTDSESDFVGEVVGTEVKRRRRNKIAIVAAFSVLSTLVLAAAIAVVFIRDAADAKAAAADEARAAEVVAREQERAAKVEATRAQAAEGRLAKQLEALRKEQADRKAAEERAAKSDAKLTLTYDELEDALAAAKSESAKKRAETERAVRALERAAKAAARERELRDKTEQLLREKRKELERVKNNRGKINKGKLEGVP